MKPCLTCKTGKSLSHFRKRTDSKDGYAQQCKECQGVKIREWRKGNPVASKMAKQKYYTSEKGKAQKKKEDRAYVLSGGRAKADKRRALNPLSEARKLSKWVYSARKRSVSYKLTELDRFVLIEAVTLARVREVLTNFDWHVDHIVPISKSGTNGYDNIQVVPAIWNRQKSNKHTDKYFG